MLIKLALPATLILSAALAPVASAQSKPLPELNLSALQQPLQDLTPDERKIVDEATRLIRANQHAEALAALTRLTQANPRNSSLRVLRAYAFLEAGNVAEALSDATAAESSGGHAAYRCWFLAQVAFLAGDKPLCRREIKHVSPDPTYGADAKKLGQTLSARRP